MNTKKSYVGLIVSVIVLVIVAAVAGLQYSAAKKALSEAETLKLEFDGSGPSAGDSSDVVDKSLRTQMKELTGYDDKRVKTDDMNAEAFFKTILKWDDYEQYNENRQEVIKRGVPEDSNFLQVFFPEIRVATDSEGNTYNTLDNGDKQLNMDFGSLDIRVVGIDGDVYSYFGTLVLTTDTSYERTDGSEHDIVGTGKCIVTYDMDADGNISNLDGYVL